MQKSLAGDLALITSEAELRRDVALPIVTTAQPHDAHPLYWWQTVPGIGTMRRLVLRYAIHQIDRVPRGQDVLSYCRLGQGRQASAGTRLGTSGANIGHAHLQWACAEAAVLCRSDHRAAQTSRARLENQHATGQA